jgi:phosphoglycolate phosphatase-like HAD superfamily hydrolase
MHNVSVLTSHPLKAVFWDFDGTLADTRERNLSVNRRIFEEVTGRSWREVAGLSSVEAYVAAWTRVRNWQELYTLSFGLTEEQCAVAGQRWAPYQLDDTTPVPLLDGIDMALRHIRKFPQAVVSQNERATIADVLKGTCVDHYFSAIVGYAEVPIDRQKPAPDGLLNALDIVGIEEPASLLYIGDHETDMLCAAATNRDLAAMGRDYRFLSVAALYQNGNRGVEWSVTPDYRVYRPSEISQLVDNLCVDQL